MESRVTARRTAATAAATRGPGPQDPAQRAPHTPRHDPRHPALQETRPRRGWDTVAVLKNAGVCGIAIGSTYGTMAALNGFLRAHPRVPRSVKVGAARNNQWVVLEGLKAGEQVMVDGFQKMMNPKAPVKAVPWQQPSAQAGMGAAPAPTAAASAAASK